MLIPHVFSHYNFPQKFVSSHIQSMYSKLKGRVKTKEWESESFMFLQCAFQGDPYSGIFFLVVFNPIIEYIKTFKEIQGYPRESKINGIFL